MCTDRSAIPLHTAESVVFCGSIRCWTGGKSATWYFLDIDGDAAHQIAGHALMRRFELGQGRGFGSVKVLALIGDSRWHTSVFPTKGQENWMLPIKAAIRSAEGLGEGDTATCTLTLL